jgi:hypothetical protein
MQTNGSSKFSAQREWRMQPGVYRTQQTSFLLNTLLSETAINESFGSPSHPEMEASATW